MIIGIFADYGTGKLMLEEKCCQECGFANLPEERFCRRCGIELLTETGDMEQILVYNLDAPPPRSGINLMNIIVAIVVAVVILAIAIPGNSRHGNRGRARMKACMANMRVLQGAVEMYNMDSTTMMHSLGEDGIDRLVAGKYLKAHVVCPEHPPGHYFSTGDLAQDGVISCSVHGTVDNPVTPD